MSLTVADAVDYKVALLKDLKPVVGCLLHLFLDCFSQLLSLVHFIITNFFFGLTKLNILANELHLKCSMDTSSICLLKRKQRIKK